MLENHYRQIYHFHLKKCGGTTLNSWLDTLTSDERAFNPNWIGSWLFGGKDEQLRAEQEASEALNARALFHWSDVVHSHAVLRPYAPPGTFCFTMLREPTRRVVSQVMDWRRLRPSDTTFEPPQIRECALDSHPLPLRAFLERHGHGGGRMVLDNYMTRALAAGRIGRLVLDVGDAGRLLDSALQSLEEDYDFVALTERFDLGRNALCALIGLPPVTGLSPLNVSPDAGKSEHEVADACDILEELTRFDRIVYDRASQLFDARHRDMSETYDAAAFEQHHAVRLLDELRGVHWNGATRYSVGMPLIGSGLHGRDAAGTASCAVWTGPGSRATLYIPTPPNMALSLLVWIQGYAAEKQRGQLRVWVNGRPAVHYFEPAEGYADLLTVDLFSTGNFVRLEIDVGEAAASGEPGSEQGDPRKRGIRFDTYGWRPVVDVEPEPDAEGVRDDD